MGVDVMRPIFNLEPKYRVTILNRVVWTKGPGAPPEIKGLVWFTDGPKMEEGPRAGVYGQSLRRRLSFSLGRYATVFQAEIYGILACVHVKTVRAGSSPYRRTVHTQTHTHTHRRFKITLPNTDQAHEKYL